MQDRIIDLKERVSNLAQNETFIHHKWFLRYHLELVETISLELYEKYSDSDRELLQGLIWIHDYGKIVG